MDIALLGDVTDEGKYLVKGCEVAYAVVWAAYTRNKVLFPGQGVHVVVA